MNPILVAQGLSKRFGEHVVFDRIDLTCAPGSITVLLGPNGAGKSTLLRCLLGLERCTAESLRIAGFDPRKRPHKTMARVGFVPDRPDAPEWMTPTQLFRFLGAQYPKWNTDKAQRLVAQFRLPMETPLKRLSLGQSMQAMLIAALSPEPELLVLDEPFSGLDPAVRDGFLGALIAETELESTAVLVSTHDLEVAARLADRIAHLADGQLTIEEREAHVSSAVRLRTLFEPKDLLARVQPKGTSHSQEEASA